MLFNIKTGYGGLPRRPNEEIVILVSSSQAMSDHHVSMLYTDRHAYVATARWTAEPGDLKDMLDWDILRRHDFARSDQYPDKMERYQAEALAHRHVPPAALLGVGCVSPAVKSIIEAQVGATGPALRAVVRPEWYF